MEDSAMKSFDFFHSAVGSYILLVLASIRVHDDDLCRYELTVPGRENHIYIRRTR